MEMSALMETALSGEGYSVLRDAQGGEVALKGVLRLNGMAEYAPILAVFSELVDQRAALVIDVRELEFLNSSGIAMLSRFVIDARNAGHGLRIHASETIPWQGKSLRNLQRLMPSLELTLG